LSLCGTQRFSFLLNNQIFFTNTHIDKELQLKNWREMPMDFLASARPGPISGDIHRGASKHSRYCPARILAVPMPGSVASF
jgi:hypothetical protein